ncbi:ATP-binding protein [Luteimonas sp. S4-F44]|uniref:sensor histidine kinase n=1 Tax=Luteimonas sp. S4-F44 TaxID=2925842 RepID=UPI001F5317DB|nr:ATP-binding protein [Luteimonas sp. S4-F44]UNK43087.1 ATP-binding protein [Luteimonas sp. S4-F44]
MMAGKPSFTPTTGTVSPRSDAARPMRGHGSPPDPVVHRNAAMLQGVLAVYGVYYPMATALGWERLGGPTDPVTLGLAFVHIAVIWGGFVAARLGFWRQATHAFVFGSLVVLSIAYPRWGLAALGPQQMLHLLPILIAGVLVGRRTLWAATAWLGGLFIFGAWTDTRPLLVTPDHVWRVSLDVGASLVGLTLVAFVVDQALIALHQSLDLARQRGADLARARDRLLLEIEQRERQQTQLLHAQKMEAVGRLASTIAHDFNHLLALVMGHAGRGLASDDPAEMKAALRSAESAARRAGETSHRLVDFSRHDDTAPETFDAVEAIADLEPVLRRTFLPGVDVGLDLDPSARLAIHFDRAHLELILLGMAANAQQAMPDGGQFTLSVAAYALDRVEIIACDTGRGMDATTRARCFEPFFTTRPAAQAAGLGLAVAAHLVREAGGDITVESAPGQGSAFRIVLPRQEQAPDTARTGSSRRPRMSRQALRQRPVAGEKS